MKKQWLTYTLSALFITGSPLAAAESPAYVAHEWGTFTSVQGSDGELIKWNPYVGSDLPEFVLTRENPFPLTQEQQQALVFQSLVGKGNTKWLQRMETPVIYFHAKENITVDVDVSFPDGLITEWYPAVSSFGPANTLFTSGDSAKRSHTAWNNLLVLGESRDVYRVPPADSENHYFTARTHDAAPVRVQNAAHPSQLGQAEQFLFYRGAGNFQTPLHVTVSEDGVLALENRGVHPIGRLFAYRKRDARIAFQEIDGLAAGALTRVHFGETAGKASTDLGNSFEKRIQNALVSAGLYASEAEAMVKTWRNDWLGDRGLRVIYLLSENWTEETLPLKLNPAPTELVRVMVGRAEIIEPDVELAFDQVLEQQMTHSAVGDLAESKGRIEYRFLEPAISAAVDRRLERLDREALDEETLARMKNRVRTSGNRLSGLMASAAPEVRTAPAGMLAAVMAEQPVSRNTVVEATDAHLFEFLDCGGGIVTEDLLDNTP